MIYQVFSVRDSKAGAYAPPFFLHRVEVAIRTFKDALGHPDHPMSAHPEDYSLYRLGEYDDETGLVSGLAEPEFIQAGKVPSNG